MSRQCPQCHRKIDEFAVNCEHCDWGHAGPVKQKPPADVPVLEVDLHLERALESIENEDFESALLGLNRAIVDCPAERLGECLSLRGYVHLKNGDFSRSETDCSEAIDRHWHEAQTLAWRAAARGEQNKWRLAFDDLETACRVAGNQRDQYLQLMSSYLKPASEYFRDQVKLGRDDADMFSDRGWIYFQADRYDKAERDFRNALQMDRRHPWACLGLARCCLKKEQLDEGQLAKVIKLCNAAVQGDHQCRKSALRIRARAFHRVGDVTRASKDLKRLRELTDDDPKELVELGELRLELGGYVEAIGDFSEALESKPDLHTALVRRAECYRKIRNYALALDDYGRFLRVYPDDLDTRIRRGQVYLKTGKLEQASEDFDRALLIDKTCFDAYLGRAKICCRQDQLELALAECQKAVRLDNQSPDAYATLAEICRKLGDSSGNLDAFNRAVQLAPDPESQAEYLCRRGETLYRREDYSSAMQDFTRATRLRPRHPGSWIWKAAACARLEKWPEAILGLQQAISLESSSADPYQELGQTVARRAIEYFNHRQQRGKSGAKLFRSRGLARQFLGDYEQAVDDYTSALNMDPQASEVLIWRGQCLARLNNHDQAIRDFTQVIQSSGDNHRARYCRAVSRLARGRFDESLSDIIKAIKLDPRHARYHLFHGELVQKQGDWGKVIKACDRALRIDPADPVIYRRRGAARLQCKQYLKAISDFTRALELRPNQPEIRVQRGQAYFRDGQLKAAIEDFEVALLANEKLAKAYSGRTAVLVAQSRHESALQWITRAIHRFSLPADLGEILFARGKVFYQMRRFEPAIADFNSVVELLRDDPTRIPAVRMARGIARVQINELEPARQDFRRLLQVDPENEQAKIALEWLREPVKPRPPMFAAPKSQIRPTRPPVVGPQLDLSPTENYLTSAPYDSWILRTASRKEYGPIPKRTLDVWVSEGRALLGMKLLRADWSKWKRIERVYPELDPARKAVDEFPRLDTKRTFVPPEEPVVQEFESILPDILNRQEEPITDLPNIIDRDQEDE